MNGKNYLIIMFDNMVMHLYKNISHFNSLHGKLKPQIPSNIYIPHYIFCLPQTYGVFLVMGKMCIFKPYQCSVFFFLFTVNESKYRACYLNGIPLRKLPFGICTLKKENHIYSIQRSENI